MKLPLISHAEKKIVILKAKNIRDRPTPIPKFMTWACKEFSFSFLAVAYITNQRLIFMFKNTLNFNLSIDKIFT